MLLRITAFVFATLVARGAHGQAPNTTDKKSCCTAISSRVTLFAAATTATNAACYGQNMAVT